MAQLVALLRGINVGPHNRIKMADLRAWLEDDGYTDVRTLLQSGNIVLRTGKKPETVERAITRLIAREIDKDIDVVVRTEQEMAKVIADDPLADVADDGAKYVVMFLSKPADAAAARDLVQQDFGEEQLRVSGREVYAWCPRSLHDGPLAKALGKQKLAPSATIRNWNTVLKLQAMFDAAG
jgi:uncharacterized protein (DUF1697 family)